MNDAHSIVVIGSVAFDDIVTRHGTVTDALGGSALYFAAAASLFAPVDIVGVVGEDFPMHELDFLKSRGVGLECLKVVKGGKTFRWRGEYELDMNKRTTTNLELNVFNEFSPSIEGRCRKSEFVFLGNIDPEIQLRVIDVIDSPKFMGADTIECYIQDKPDQLKKVLARVQLLIINDSEAQLITGEHNIFTAAKALRDLGPSYIVIKKGEHGSILISDDSLFVVPAYPIDRVVDPTGAGDSYAGALMGYCSQAYSLDEATLRSAVVYAGVVASFTVEAFSIDALRMLTRRAVDDRVRVFRTLTAF